MSINKILSGSYAISKQPTATNYVNVNKCWYTINIQLLLHLLISLAMGEHPCIDNNFFLSKRKQPCNKLHFVHLHRIQSVSMYIHITIQYSDELHTTYIFPFEYVFWFLNDSQQSMYKFCINAIMILATWIFCRRHILFVCSCHLFL